MHKFPRIFFSRKDNPKKPNLLIALKSISYLSELVIGKTLGKRQHCDCAWFMLQVNMLLKCLGLIMHFKNVSA